MLNFCDSSRSSGAATSAGGVSTDYGLFDFDAMIGQFASTGRVGPAELFFASVNIEKPSRKKLTAQKKFTQRTKYYPSLSAKTLFNDFFESDPPTVLDPGHTTTSVSPDQVLRIARAVFLHVTLASNGLSKTCCCLKVEFAA